MIVDEGFFNNIFEKERKKEQARLNKIMGGKVFLSQRKFTALLAKQNVRFKFPEQKLINPKPLKRRKL